MEIHVSRSPLLEVDLTKVEDARAFAAQKHLGQTRKGAGEVPYFTHLQEVAGLVERFGGSQVAISAAWLHDTVEDCGVAPSEVEALFGPEVAAVVAEVTDDKLLEKQMRKRLQVAHAPHKSADGALIKICDKMSNIRSVAEAPPLHWDLARKRAYLGWADEVDSLLAGHWPEALTAIADHLAA